LAFGLDEDYMAGNDCCFIGAAETSIGEKDVREGYSSFKAECFKFLVEDEAIVSQIERESLMWRVS
jgi:hypothetical protein